MDAEHERVRADDPLRVLFHDVGHLRGPVDLETNVLSRLAEHAAVVTPAPPLLSKRSWYVLSAFGLVILGLAFKLSTPSYSGIGTMHGLQLPNVTAFFNSPWALTAMASIVFLLALDRFLGGLKQNSSAI